MVAMFKHHYPIVSCRSAFLVAVVLVIAVSANLADHDTSNIPVLNEKIIEDSPESPQDASLSVDAGNFLPGAVSLERDSSSQGDFNAGKSSIPSASSVGDKTHDEVRDISQENEPTRLDETNDVPRGESKVVPVTESSTAVTPDNQPSSHPAASQLSGSRFDQASRQESAPGNVENPEDQSSLKTAGENPIAQENAEELNDVDNTRQQLTSAEDTQERLTNEEDTRERLTNEEDTRERLTNPQLDPSEPIENGQMSSANNSQIQTSSEANTDVTAPEDLNHSMSVQSGQDVDRENKDNDRITTIQGTAINMDLNKQIEPANLTDSDAHVLSAFSMYTSDPFHFDPDFDREPVFLESSFVGAWNSCRVHGQATNLKNDGCFVAPEYSEQISFAFAITEFDSSYSFSPPRVAAWSQSVESSAPLEPEVADFEYDENDLSGGFTVIYHCLRGVEDTAFIVLEFAVRDSVQLYLKWFKMCRSGPSKYLEPSYLTASGQRQKLGSSVLVPASIAVTEVYLDVKGPAVSQHFAAPQVTSSDPAVLSVTTRGSAGVGITSLNNPSSFSILYSCLTNGKANVLLTVPLQPWDAINATIVKDCGGGTATCISIGTKSGKSDVVHEGVTTSSYFESLQSAMDGVGLSLASVGPSVHDSSFVIRHDKEGEEPVEFSNAVVTVGDSMILRVSVKGLLSSVDKLSLEFDEQFKLTTHFICLRKGRTWVVVSLPLMRYRPLEFGFTKECEAPRIYKESSLLTVPGVFKLLLICVVVCVIAMWVCSKAGRTQSTGGPKYDRLVQV